MAAQNLKFVDTLRGLAILGVLIVHSTQVGAKLPNVQENLFKQGAKGVQLFFITSAFTLFVSLSRRRHETKPYLKFCLRRLFRIAPMYWIGILFYIWLNKFWLQPYAIKAISLNIVFLHGFDPFSFNSVVPGGWSIGVEMIFYLIVPFLFLCLKSFSNAVWFTLCTLLLHCFILIMLLNYSPSLLSNPTYFFYLNNYLLGSMPVFGMGFVLFYMYNAPFSFKQLLLLPLSVLFICFMLHMLQLDYIYLLLSLGFVAIAYALSQDKLTFLNNPVLGHLGKVSFSLYLVHFTVLRFFHYNGITDFVANPLLSYLLRLLSLLLVAVPIATLFNKLVEVPCQAVGKQIIKHLDRSNELKNQV